MLVAEEKERERVLMERLKALERKKLEKKKKNVMKIDAPDLKKDPEPSSDDETTHEPAPKPKKKKVVAPPPSSESELSESEEDEIVLRKRARREIRAERDSVLAQRYKKNVEDLKLQELKEIMRGNRY